MTARHDQDERTALRAVCGIPVLEVLARQEHAPERGLCRRCAGLAHPAATVTRSGEPAAAGAGNAGNAGDQEG